MRDDCNNNSSDDNYNVDDDWVAVLVRDDCNNNSNDNNDNDDDDNNSDGVMCDIMVSMSAFLAYHQCLSVDLSLGWGLNLWALVCGIF